MNQQIPQAAQNYRPEIDWPTSLFLVITPIAALVLTPIHIIWNGLSWGLILLLVIYGGVSNLSITAGYHRLFSHQSYQASLWVKLGYLFFGAGAFQGSALKWCTDHRRHHRYVDTENDPYNIRRGFFFAHMGWLFLKDRPEIRNSWAPDLARDKWISLQHKYYVPLAIFSGFGLPTFIGWAMGAPLGGLIFGGALRIVITQHTTFLINSYCHYFGKQTYGTENSAKDSLFISFFTHGEGYHNFHHHFQADYRNGIRWFDWDPTKWFIRGLSAVGLAKGLRRVPKEKIIRAQVDEQARTLLQRGANAEWVVRLRTRVEDSAVRWQALKRECVERKRQLKVASDEKIKELKIRYQDAKLQMKVARREFKLARREWKIGFRQMAYVRVRS